MNKDILKQLRKQANDFQIIKGWKVRHIDMIHV